MAANVVFEVVMSVFEITCQWRAPLGRAGKKLGRHFDDGY
jgi:hypothetical protein